MQERKRNTIIVVGATFECHRCVSDQTTATILRKKCKYFLVDFVRAAGNLSSEGEQKCFKDM